MTGKYKVVWLFVVAWSGAFAASELSDAGFWPLALLIAILCPIAHNALYYRD